MTHGLIPHPAGAAVQGPISTLCAELLRMIRRESAAGFARPRQDVRHPPHGNVRAFICRLKAERRFCRRVNTDDTSTLKVSATNHRRWLVWFGAGSNPANGSICAPCEGATQHAGHLTA